MSQRNSVSANENGDTIWFGEYNDGPILSFQDGVVRVISHSGTDPQRRRMSRFIVGDDLERFFDWMAQARALSQGPEDKGTP